MYYLDSVIFSDYYYRNGTVGKKALFTTYNDPTKFDFRTFIWTGDIFSHFMRQSDGISQYVKSTGTMFVYKKI